MTHQDYKYELEVIKLEKPMKVDEKLLEDLKNARISRKMISEMKKEAVQCPILGRQVSFLQCYNCKNFVRRVRGRVFCRGDPL
ncbi:hypothetical protein [Thermofilum pendens]|uniref:Uncharacterized protein n=1 Tax=Thermofilum pendens (strain DSM 2475 / Hrk 5) TaxID=368408 RepID=A1RX12_THEPD|nr:hypothetical protein [Thermofilum pendens]ABL77742.1 hypothetical protein Tpen_0333 [Thermofilum pendens Hrk 5]